MSKSLEPNQHLSASVPPTLLRQLSSPSSSANVPWLPYGHAQIVRLRSCFSPT
jgi:hypothetical protein